MRLIKKLSAYEIAKHIVTDLENDGKITISEIESICVMRDSLNERVIKVSVFLVVSLLAISLAIFGVEPGGKIHWLGFRDLERNHMIFAAFVIGNALFVVSFGTFWKQLVTEYIILCICESRKLDGGRQHLAFRYTPARYIFYTFGHYTRQYARRLPFSRYYLCLLSFVATYSTLGILVIYGFLYFSLLGVFLFEMWTCGELFIFLVLFFMNMLCLTHIFLICHSRTREW